MATKKKLLLIGFALWMLAACGSAQQEQVQTIVAALPEQPVAPVVTASLEPTGTPPMSSINIPALAPTMDGPMGTLTAMAITIPTQDATPYVVVNRGRPHFIEFHAWW